MEGRPNPDAAPVGVPGREPAEEPPAPVDIVDEAIAASFPASDPPAWWAGPRD